MGEKLKRTRVPKQPLVSVTVPGPQRSVIQYGYLSQLRRMARIYRYQLKELNSDGVLLVTTAITGFYRECADVSFAGPAEFELEKEGLTELIFKGTDQT